MTKSRPLFAGTLIALLQLLLALNFSISAAAQSSTSLHLTLGNPSGATSSTSNYTNYLMLKSQYALSYNRNWATPNWVAWHLGSEDLGSAPRQDDFRADTLLPSGWYRVQSSDYTNSGYDRGHMTPSADCAPQPYLTTPPLS